VAVFGVVLAVAYDFMALGPIAVSPSSPCQEYVNGGSPPMVEACHVTGVFTETALGDTTQEIVGAEFVVEIEVSPIWTFGMQSICTL
jgi:hypothetical protein